MKHRTQKLVLITEILLIFMMLVPLPAFGAQTATLSVNPSSGVITYPTYTINIVISPVTNLWMAHFTLSFNDKEDFLEVPAGGVQLGDFFAGKKPDLSTGQYYLADTGLSYLEVLIEMPGNETVTSTESKSLAKVTFKLLSNAMPGMTSWLKLEWADATFFIGSGEPPYESINSKTGGITFPQQGTVTLGYLVTTLTMNPATATVEKSVTLSSTIKDGGGNPIAGLSIDYYVGPDKIGSAITNEYGISSITYTPPNVGTFTIKAEYVGNLPGGKYASSSDTDTLTVNKMSTTLSLSVQSSIKVGDAVDLAATLKKDGTIMAGSTVSFSILPPGGGWTSIGSAPTNSSGIAAVKYTFGSQGTYEIKAEYSGTANYAPSSDTTTRTVAMTRTSLELTVTPATTKVNQAVTLSATLKTEGGAALSDRTITYYVNTVQVNSSKTDTSGFSWITYTPSEASPADGWKVEARYAGDSTYSSSVDTATLVVDKLATTLELTVEPTTISIEQTTIMTATLKDEGANPIPGANIDFYIKLENRWTKIDSAITDAKGIASLDYKPNTTGTLLVKANYTGSASKYPVSSELVVITVNKLNTTLTLSMPTTAKVEQTIMVSATLKDQSLTPKAIPNVTIEYYLLTVGQEQTIGTAKTNQNGVASLPYTPTNVGTFQIKATFSESTKYVASSASKELTVNPLTTTLTLNTPPTTRVGDTVTLIATLKDEKEQALRGVPIEYSIYSGGAWNKIGTAITNSSGIATRDYTPSEAGTFVISAEFEAYAKYAGTTSQEVTLIVNKVQTTLTISLSNTTTTTETSITISATLKDEDAQPISRSNIYYQIFKEGQWIGIGSTMTNLQGTASMNFTEGTEGTFRIKAVYNGDPKYAESTSEEATLEVTGGGTPPGNPFDFLGFLGDNQLTILDFLFWGAIMMAFSIIVVVSIWRKIKSSEIQTSAKVSPKRGRHRYTSQSILF